MFSRKCEHCGSRNHNYGDCPHRVFARRKQETDEVEAPVESEAAEGCAKPIAVLVVAIAVIAAVVWLVANVVLPLVLLNSAVIFTILALSVRTRSTIFASGAVAGVGYMLTDIANGWLSANFVRNVVGSSTWLTAFVYLNAVALGVSVWLLARPLFSGKDAGEQDEAGSRPLLRSAGVVIVAVGVVAPPAIYHATSTPFGVVQSSSASTQGTRPESSDTAAIEASAMTTPARLTTEASSTDSASETIGVTTSTDAMATGTMVTAPSEAQTASEDRARVRVVSVSMAMSHVCVITTEGRSYCWGKGPISRPYEWLPTVAPVGAGVAAVSTNGSVTCWLTTSGDAQCAGSNGSGMLGNGAEVEHTNIGWTRPDSPAPTAVAGDLKFSAISVGKNHVCGLATDGAAYCWGDNRFHQLGNNVVKDTSTPAPVSGGFLFKALSAGEGYTCALTMDGDPYCWGMIRIRDLVTLQHPAPTAVPGGFKFASISVGEEDRVCALTAAGKAYCWGDGTTDGLGTGKKESSEVPLPVADDLTFKNISVGPEHICGVTTDGAAHCWGEGGSHLGNESRDDALSPVRVPGDFDFQAVSTGWYTSCATTTRGALYCWGSNRSGSLAGATRERRSVVPIEIRLQEN
jgi:alpha-tubulin suppressor-like RCC1 family protein